MRFQSEKLEQLAPLSDEEVVGRVLAGDTGAFELLMRRHNQRLFRTARSVLSNDTDAMDALQEAYIRVYKGLSAFEKRSTLATWMTRIVFNESIRFRSRRARVTRRERVGVQQAAAESQTQLPESCMDGMERMRRFDEAMDALTENERGVVMLRVIHGLSTRETALSLGLSESNVKVSLFRAKPKLAAVLGGDGVGSVRQSLTFDGTRCDRLVRSVFIGLERLHDP